MDPIRHTFGGSALDRHVFDFETVAGDAGGTGGAPAGDGPSGTAVAAPAAAPPPVGGAASGEPDPPAGVTDPAPAWSPDNPAFLEAVDQRAIDLYEQRFGPLQQLLEQSFAGDPAAAQQGQQQQQQLLPPDPFSDNYQQELAAYNQARDEQMYARFEEMLGQVAQPLNARIQSETVAEGQQRLQDMIADDVARNGDFPRAPGQTESQAQKLIMPLAEALFPQIAERYGVGTRGAEMAIQQASSTVRAIIAEAGAAAVEAHKNQNATLLAVQGEPGTAVAGAQGLSDTQDPSEITRRYAAAGRQLGVAGS